MEKKPVNRKIVIAVWVIGVFLVWEFAAFAIRHILPIDTPDTKLPYFHGVVITFFQNFMDLAASSWVTFINAGRGFLIGTAIGCVIAFLMSWSKAIEKIAFPYLITFQMIPVLGLAPIVYKLVGGGDEAKVAISALISFFPVAVNLLDGFHSVDVQRRELLYSYAETDHILKADDTVGIATAVYGYEDRSTANHYRSDPDRDDGFDRRYRSKDLIRTVL